MGDYFGAININLDY